jgi:hypothetical protein
MLIFNQTFAALQPLDENIVSHTAQFFIRVKQDNERALQLLRGLTKASPQRARSFKLLAEFYHTVNKDVPSAIKIYQKVFIYKSFPAPFALIACIYRLLLALELPVISAIHGQVLPLVAAQKLTRMRIPPLRIVPLSSCNILQI